MTVKIYTADESFDTTNKSPIQKMPVLEEVRESGGSIYLRFSRINSATLNTELFIAYIEHEQSVFQYLLSIKGKHCKLEGKTDDGQEFTWQ